MNKAIQFLKKIRLTRKKLSIFLIIIIVGLFAGWRVLSQRAQQPQYQTARVEKGTIIVSVNASGQILTANVMNITTKALGVVKQVFVLEGDKVVAGQKIAEIQLDQAGQEQNASAYSSYISAVNSLNSANNSYRSSQASLAVVYDAVKGHDTDETLVMKETRTKAEVVNDNAYDGIKSAQAKLTSTWLSYQTTSPIITAPIAGKISNITVVAGIIVGGSTMEGQSTSSQKVATIRNENNPLVSFNLSEVDVPRTKIGQKATVILDSISGKTFTGKVVSVDKIGQVTNGVTNYPVIIQLDTQEEELLPNMASSVNIIINTKSNVLLVPSQAVQTLEGQSIVRRLRGGQIQEVPVETGLSSDTNTEIIAGLSEGDEVITSTLGTIQQGGSSPFGGGFGSFGGGALRPGGTRGGVMQH